MDPGILIPVKGYGGHERLVEMLAKEYTSLGHSVSLLVTEGSYVKDCTVYPLGAEGFPPPIKNRKKTMLTAWKFLWKHKKNFDLIHNFGRLFYLLPILNCKINKIMTYGRIIRARNIKYINFLPNKNIVFTAPSNWCVNTGNVSGKWATVYNSIDFSKYTPTNNLPSNAPLIFLSRMEKLKGAHEAIQIAKATNNTLILAGNISPLEEEKQYFKNEIEPHIDGVQIQYVGTLNDEEKNKYLGMAKAMLFPARTDEAFGMVMVEAMACGTPVLAYNHAAMPEVVTSGITGYVVNTIEEMQNAINKTTVLDRNEIRKYAEKRFDVKTVAQQYLNLVI